jgi:hypothetical protein
MVIFAGVLFAADIPSRSQVLHRFEFCFGRFFQLYSRMIERFQFMIVNEYLLCGIAVLLCSFIVMPSMWACC